MVPQQRVCGHKKSTLLQQIDESERTYVQRSCFDGCECRLRLLSSFYEPA